MTARRYARNSCGRSPPKRRMSGLRAATPAALAPVATPTAATNGQNGT
ncbi:hypothetical protein [Dactylosporangium sp. CS-033363]